MNTTHHVGPCPPMSSSSAAAAAAAAAAMSTPMATVDIIVHFGPLTAPVEEEHSLFAVATQLLQETAPQLDVTSSPSAAAAAEEEREEDRTEAGNRAVASLPLLHLPAVIVDEDSDAGSGTGGNDSSTDEIDASDRVVMSLGRAALEVRTYSHGVIVVSTWAQWETARDVVLAELCGDGVGVGGSAKACTNTSSPPRMMRVEVHVELVVLWCDMDTMTALRFADLFTEDDKGEKDAQQSPGVDAHGLHSGGSDKGHGAAATRRRSPDRLSAVDGVPALPPPLPPAPAAVSPSVSPSGGQAALLVNLVVLDGAGARRGEVQVYVAEPIVSLAELRSLVKGVLGLRRQHGVRLAYRVLAPRDLALGYIEGGDSDGFLRLSGSSGESNPGATSGGRYGGCVGEPSPASGLVPLATQHDVERLVQDVLFYGYRAIRIVAVPTADHQPASEILSAHSSFGKEVAEQEFRQVVVEEENTGAAHAKRIHASLDVLHATVRAQSPGHSSNGGQAPSHLPPTPTRTTTTPATSIAAAATVIATTPVRIQPSTSAPPLQEPAFSPPPRQPSGSTSPSHNDGMRGTRTAHSPAVVAVGAAAAVAASSTISGGGDVNGSVESKSQVSALREQQQPSPKKEPPQAPYSSAVQARTNAANQKKMLTTMTITAKRTETETEDTFSTEPSVEFAEEQVSVHGGKRTGKPVTRTRQGVVIVRYEVDPTEVFVSGPVKADLLQRLSDNIYRRCCNHPRATADGGDKRIRPVFEKVGTDTDEGAVARDDAANTSVNGKTAKPSDVYVLRLHQFDFTEEEEEALAGCVTEAMQSLDGFVPVELHE